MTNDRAALGDLPRKMLAAEYEAATDAPVGAGKRFHAANVRTMHLRDYADWKDRAALRAIAKALALTDATPSSGVEVMDG